TDVGPSGKGPILGVLYVDRRSPTRHFNDEDLSMLESFAGHAAIAIENARLYEEALEKRRMEEDLRVAHRIQRSLLLSEFPELDWAEMHALNIPSRGVGGDYYEFFTRAEGVLGFAVGDVAGKGIPAAMLMATLQAAFLSATVSHDDLGRLCHHLNDFLVERTSPERYATFFCGLLRPDGELLYVNAGHNPSLRVGDGEPQRLMGGGMPLGLFPDRDYEVQRITLQPGELIACYSDGITEANNPSEEEFGEERLKRVLVENREQGAHGLCKAVFDAVERFSAGTGQGDDLTLMIIRYLADRA
ncbi:MAG: GAF domain-containing SpoIIE family protein phosphatase, partial [Acidobacteriota bacterium]